MSHRRTSYTSSAYGRNVHFIGSLSASASPRPTNAASFFTKDSSLNVELLGKRSLRLQFAWTDVPYKAEFRVSVTFSGDIENPASSVASVSELVVKTGMTSKAVRSTELRLANAPLERLRRACPIGLVVL
jgi:hypothetical protein